MNVVRAGAGHQFVGYVVDGDNVLVFYGTVLEYTHTATNMTARCVGSLTTIAHFPQLSTPADDMVVKAEVSANE